MCALPAELLPKFETAVCQLVKHRDCLVAHAVGGVVFLDSFLIRCSDSNAQNGIISEPQNHFGERFVIFLPRQERFSSRANERAYRLYVSSRYYQPRSHALQNTVRTTFVN